MKLNVPYRRQLMVPAMLEMRDDGAADEFILSGHAGVFDRRSEDLGGFTEIINRGAFRKALDNHDDVRLLINHAGLPLARTKSATLELREDPRGLFSYARVPATERTRELRTLMQRGDIDQMSFAFTLAEDGSGETWEQDQDGNVTRTIHEIERLYDVSVVTYPAYPQTDAQMRSVAMTFDGPGPTEELDPEGVTAEAGDIEHEARSAALRELRERSKRRLSLAIHT